MKIIDLTPDIDDMAVYDTESGYVNCCIAQAQPEPTPPAPIGNPKIFTAGNATGILYPNGDLYLTGRNDYGQFGLNDKNERHLFVKVKSNVKKVITSSYTTWIIDNNDDLWGCGRNDHGQQGSGDTNDVLVFTKRAENVVECYCTTTTTAYLTKDDQLYMCGENTHGQQSSGNKVDVNVFTLRASNVKMVALTNQGSFYIKNDENMRMFGCGQNNYGQQGNKKSESASTDVTTFTNSYSSNSGNFVACNAQLTYLLKTNNELWLTGYSTYQAFTATGYRSSFTKIAENVKEVYPPNIYTIWYIDLNNNLMGYGYNNTGQQGSGNTTNVFNFTKRAENVKKVIGQTNVTAYLTNAGDFFIAGSNTYGQQGDGTNTNVLNFTKRAENVIDFVGTNTHFAYLTEVGKIYVCGRNNYGQLGLGDTTDRNTFSEVTL